MSGHQKSLIVERKVRGIVNREDIYKESLSVAKGGGS